MSTEPPDTAANANTKKATFAGAIEANATLLARSHHSVAASLSAATPSSFPSASRIRAQSATGDPLGYILVDRGKLRF